MMSKEEKEIIKTINKLKTKLILKARRYGVYENFGQKEVGLLKAKYSDFVYGTENERNAYSLIEQFDEWCQNYA